MLAHAKTLRLVQPWIQGPGPLSPASIAGSPLLHPVPGVWRDQDLKDKGILWGCAVVITRYVSGVPGRLDGVLQEPGQGSKARSSGPKACRGAQLYAYATPQNKPYTRVSKCCK